MVPTDPSSEIGRQCNEDFQELTEEMGNLTRVVLMELDARD